MAMTNCVSFCKENPLIVVATVAAVLTCALIAISAYGVHYGRVHSQLQALNNPQWVYVPNYYYGGSFYLQTTMRVFDTPLAKGAYISGIVGLSIFIAPVALVALACCGGLNGSRRRYL